MIRINYLKLDFIVNQQRKSPHITVTSKHSSLFKYISIDKAPLISRSNIFFYDLMKQQISIPIYFVLGLGTSCWFSNQPQNPSIRQRVPGQPGTPWAPDFLLEHTMNHESTLGATDHP